MNKLKNTLIASTIGVVVGFFNGFFGSGGGTIVVPAMEKFMKTSTHKAHATAVAVILPLSIVSAFVYVRGADVDWVATIIISLGGMAGGFIGARLLKKTPPKILHKLFGACMILAGVRMIF